MATADAVRERGMARDATATGVAALGSGDYFRDPYATMRWLRENAPIYFDPPTGAWFLTRHADIGAALKDERLRHVMPPGHGRPPLNVGERVAHLPPGADRLYAMRVRSEYLHSLWMGLHDLTDHTRLKALLSPAVSPARVAALTPRIQALADQLVDEALAAGGADLVTELADPLAITVISEIMGVPPQPNLPFAKWSRDLERILDPYTTFIDRERALLAIYRYAEFFEGLIAERRRERRDDFISRMIAAEERGELRGDELLAHCIDLFFAGHQSTGYSLANAVLGLLQHPEQFRWLKDNLDQMTGAAEELLRFGAPIIMTNRIAHADLELGGQLIKTGEHLRLMIGAANRDPARFAEPERLNLARTPNAHLVFGYGVHYCLGAALARAEMQVLVGTLARRAPSLRLQVSEADLQWEQSFLVRGVKTLPVAF